MPEERGRTPSRGLWVETRLDQMDAMRWPVGKSGARVSPTNLMLLRREVLADMRIARALHAEGFYSEAVYEKMRGFIVQTMRIARRFTPTTDPYVAEDRIEEERRRYSGLTGEFNFSTYTNYA